MPPPARVCQACKASKVRCADYVPGVQCPRCKRLGLECMPASQQPVEATMPLALQFRAAPSAVGANVPSTISVAQPSPPLLKETASDIVQSIFSCCQNKPEVQKFTLRHMAAVALERNAHDLLNMIVQVCKEKSIELSEVLYRPNDDDEIECTRPTEILQVVSASDGYCLARSVGLSGRSTFFSNASFERDVVSLERCMSVYEHNEAELHTLFLHPDDTAAFQKLVSRAFQQAACNSGQLTKVGSAERLRVFLHRRGAYIDCQVQVWFFVLRERCSVRTAFEFLPHGTDAMLGMLADASMSGEELAMPRADVCVAIDDVLAEGLPGGSEHDPWPWLEQLLAVQEAASSSWGGATASSGLGEEPRGKKARL